MRLPLSFALAFVLCAAESRPASAFEFAAIGDLPYSEADSLGFDRLRDRINAEDLAFVLHVGDIKGGGSSCDDAALESRVRMFSTFRHPFLLLPGDNEWTDCHRGQAGGWSPLERLARLRSLFFSPPGRTLGGGSLPVVSQASDPAYAEFPEHTRWTLGGVVFVGLHLVGSDNAMADFPDRGPENDAEVERRTRAAIAWMAAAFQQARETGAGALLVAMQANPRFETDQRKDPPQVFTEFLRVLAEETADFGRPVVLVHGDSHYFRVDKPLAGLTSHRSLSNFTRLEVFGSPNMHWVRVQVDREDPQVFRFHPEIIPEHAQLD